MIHSNVLVRLNHFATTKSVPHLLLYGPPHSGKRTLLHHLLVQLYGTDKSPSILTINCAYGKGLQCVRDDVKHFAKLVIPSNVPFKMIVLQNADQLNMDAQSALRRCIELYSHSTRFVFLVQDKHSLMPPILSRLCEIHVPLVFDREPTTDSLSYLTECLDAIQPPYTAEQWINYCAYLYNQGYCAQDLLDIYSDNVELLFFFDQAKLEIRDERLLMLWILINHFK